MTGVIVGAKRALMHWADLVMALRVGNPELRIVAVGRNRFQNLFIGKAVLQKRVQSGLNKDDFSLRVKLGIPIVRLSHHMECLDKIVAHKKNSLTIIRVPKHNH